MHRLGKSRKVREVAAQSIGRFYLPLLMHEGAAVIQVGLGAVWRREWHGLPFFVGAEPREEMFRE